MIVAVRLKQTAIIYGDDFTEGIVFDRLRNLKVNGADESPDGRSIRHQL